MYQQYPGAEREAEQISRPPAPSSVTIAVRLMYLGAVASLAGVIIGLLRGISKSAIEKAAPNLTASQVNTAASVALVSIVIVGIIGIGAWIWIAQASKKGSNAARITGTVFFGLDTLSLLLGLRRPENALVKGYPIVIWLIGLAVVILLWQRESTRFFTPNRP
jgi:hypothetical protein